MKLIALAFAVVVLVLVFSKISIHSVTAQTDTAAARVPLENYIQGHATGNGEDNKQNSIRTPQAGADRNTYCVRSSCSAMARRINSMRTARFSGDTIVMRAMILVTVRAPL